MLYYVFLVTMAIVVIGGIVFTVQAFRESPRGGIVALAALIAIFLCGFASSAIGETIREITLQFGFYIPPETAEKISWAILLVALGFLYWVYKSNKDK